MRRRSAWLRVGRLLIGAIGLALLAACGDNEPQEIAAVPTRTLIPPTASPTAIPIETTPTPTDLPSAAALVTLPDTDTAPTIPALAQAMIDRTTADLMAQPDVEPADVRLLGLEAITWRDAVWGCQTRRDSGDPDLLLTPGYRIIFSTGERAVVYHTDRRETFFVCEDGPWLAHEGDPIPLDPIAELMVELSARDAAKQWDVPAAQARLTSLIAVDWPDSSVGCPRAGAEYQTITTPGYRIVFRLGDERLIYHTSIRHAVRCAPNEEILPGLLRDALPGSTE